MAAADVPVNQQPTPSPPPPLLNPCCAVWKEKYAKLLERRNALKQAINVLTEQVDKVHAENLSLKKACDEERERVKTETEEKEKELEVRVALENEISALRAEISSIRLNGNADAGDKTGELKVLRDEVSEGKMEINRLKELLEEEKIRADSEQKIAEKEKKSAAEASKQVKELKTRAEKERKLADTERKKVNEYRIKLEALKKESDEAKSQLIIQSVKFEETIKKLEAEKHKLTKERKCADSEKAKLEELWKLAEANAKKAMEDISHVESLSRQLEDARRTIEEMQRADEGRKSGDIEAKKPEEYQLQLGQLKREIDEANSKLAVQTVKFEKAKRKLEAEKRKVAKERKRADSEMARARELERLVEANQKKAMEEDSRAESLSGQLEGTLRTIEDSHKVDEESKHANIKEKKADDDWLQLEAVKKEAEETKSKLAMETLKLEELTRKFEEEKNKMTRERECTDIEMAKSDKQRHLLERKLMEEKSHAECLRRQLEDAQQRTEKLQKEMHMFMSSINLSEAPCDHLSCNPNVEAAKIRYQLWLESLKKDADRLCLALDFLKSDVVTNYVDFDSQKVKQSAEMGMVKAEEQRKLVEMYMKMAMEERSHTYQLSRQLEDYRKKVELLGKEIQKLLPFGKGFQSPDSLTDKDLNSQRTKMKHLEKQLKLEKIRLKTAKEKAKLEKARQTILQQELSRLKLDFDQISCRLDVVDKFFSLKSEGTKHVRKDVDFPTKKWRKMKRKISQVESFQAYPQTESKPLRPWCAAVTSSSPLGQIIDCTAPLLPVCGGNHMEMTSGIHSESEPLLGGSKQKLFQRSAINSSSASFSDGQLVGSQGRDAIATAPGNLMEDNFNVHPTLSSMSAEVTKLRPNENLGVVAENSVRSPHSTDTKQLNERGKKRRICDAIESIEYLHLEGKKLHLQMETNLTILNEMLNKQIDKPLEEIMTVEPNVQGHSSGKHDRHHKKRKLFYEEKVIMQSHIDKLQNTEGVWNDIQDDANECRHTSLCAGHQLGIHPACKEGLSSSSGRELDSLAVIEEITNKDYLKLLELDDPTDEECFRRAMEMPVSPGLPDIGISTTEVFDRGEIEPLVGGIFRRGSLIEKEVPVPLHCLDVIDVEIMSNNGKHGSLGTSCNDLPYGDDSSLSHFNIKGNRDESAKGVEIILDSQTSHSVGDGKMSNLPDPGVEGECGPAHGNIPMYFVLFSDINDAGSISRIIYATKICMAFSSLDSQLVSKLQKILLGLKMQDKILTREKACAIFTTLLLSFSAFTSGKSDSLCGSDFVTCIDSFAAHINAVMSVGEGGNLFAEVCCLDELVGLIEDFLMNRRVLVYIDASSGGLTDHESRIEVLLDGAKINLSSKAASDGQLLAGSIILASICVAIGHFDVICEASYNLLRTWRCNPVLLAILHVFAYLGGNKFLSLHANSLMMTVLKSIVLFLEGRSMPLASTSTCSFAACLGAKCPFMEDALSVDDTTSILLESFQNYAVSGTMHQQQMESPHLSNSTILCPKLKPVKGYQKGHCVLDLNCDASCCLKKCVIAVTDSTSAGNGSLCGLSDLLSLLELLACNMNWEWTHDKVITELFKLLESHRQENFAMAVVVLLGQLGRLGVAACGYDDERVASVRCKISSFLSQDTNIRAALPVQIAIVNALLGLLSVNFENLMQCNLQFSASASQSVYRNLIRDWFSSLSKEQQALSSSLLQSAGVHTSEMISLLPS